MKKLREGSDHPKLNPDFPLTNFSFSHRERPKICGKKTYTKQKAESEEIIDETWKFHRSFLAKVKLAAHCHSTFSSKIIKIMEVHPHFGTVEGEIETIGDFYIQTL